MMTLHQRPLPNDRRRPTLVVALAVLALAIALSPGASTARSTVSPEQIPTDRPTRVLAIGDSVMLGAAEEIPAACHNCETVVDAAESRSTGRSAEAARGHGGEWDVVVVLLGHNDGGNSVYQRGYEDILNHFALAPHVVVMTLHEVREGYDGVNAFLRSQADQRPNVTVLDWNAEVDAHPDSVVDDGLHLTASGAELMAAQIAAAVDQARQATPTPASEPAPSDAAPTVTPYIPDGPSGTVTLDEGTEPMPLDEFPPAASADASKRSGLTGTRLALFGLLIAVAAVLVGFARTRRNEP